MSAQPYVIYMSPQSRSSRVIWGVEELAAPYTLKKVDFMAGEHRTEAFLALNPSGKVPVLVDGGFVLTESFAILTYLGERHPEAGLLPESGSRLRARYDQWCSFTITELEQPLWTMAKHRFALPPKLRVEGIEPTALKEFARAELALARGLESREYIVGDHFTLADVLVGHTLAWATAFGVPLADERVQAYADRVLARPALARARAKEAEIGSRDFG